VTRAAERTEHDPDSDGNDRRSDHPGGRDWRLSNAKTGKLIDDDFTRLVCWNSVQHLDVRPIEGAAATCAVQALLFAVRL